jgi:hypothetical protein
MSETDRNKADIDGMLKGLRREFALRAERAETIEAVAGGPVDRDIPQDYWHFSDEELENELWSRVLELDRATANPLLTTDAPPDNLSTAKPGLSGKIKGGFKKLLSPLVRHALARQDRLNRQFEHAQFIQLLVVKQLRQRLQKLERENRELGLRLAELEIEKAPGGETSGHE